MGVDEEEEDEDRPKTVWEFIYKDWKRHLELHMIDLPDLYNLFIEGWVPPKKRSYEEINAMLQGKTIDDFKGWIEAFIESRKLLRSVINGKKIKPISSYYIQWLEGDRLKTDELENDQGKKYSSSSKYNENSVIDDKTVIKKYAKKGAKLNENPMFKTTEKIGNDRIDNHKTTDIKVTNDSSDVKEARRILAKIVLDEMDKKTGTKSRRSVVEELESPAYCKFISKCELPVCDCSDPKQMV